MLPVVVSGLTKLSRRTFPAVALFPLSGLTNNDTPRKKRDWARFSKLTFLELCVNATADFTFCRFSTLWEMAKTARKPRNLRISFFDQTHCKMPGNFICGQSAVIAARIWTNSIKMIKLRFL